MLSKKLTFIFMTMLSCALMLLQNGEASAFSRAYPANGVYSLQPKCAPGAELSTDGQNKGYGANVNIVPYSVSNLKWRLTRIGSTHWYKVTVDGTDDMGLNVDNGRNTSGTNITIWKYGGAWQQFCFWDVGGGYYLLQGNIGASQAMVLDVAGGGSATSANVWSYGHNNTDAQLWKLVPAKSNPAPTPTNKVTKGDVNNDGKVDQSDVNLLERYITGLVSSLPNKDAADLNGDGRITLTDVTRLQQLIPSSDNTYTTMTDGWYRISPQHVLSMSMDALGTNNNLHMYNSLDVSQQKFYLQNRGQGWFSLKSGYSDVYVTAQGGNVGANLYMSKWQGTGSQLFRVVSAGNGYYHIMSYLGSNLNFDCAGGGTGNGTNVQLWTKETQSPHHKWKFTKESAPVTSHNPEGRVESVVSNAPGQITVRGWAFDRDDMNRAIELHVYVGNTRSDNGGEKHTGIIANRANSSSPGHGFEATFATNKTGNQPVYVYGINIGGGADANMAASPMRVNIQPTTNVNPYRQNALATAKAMVEVEWTAPCDFVTWCSSGGGYNPVTAVDGTSAYKFIAGKRYKGIPYSMAGRTYTKDRFLSYLSSHNATSQYQKKYYSHGKVTTGVGIDCSYFVWTALNASGASRKIGGNYTTTGTLLNSGCFSARSYDNMKPGDIFLKSGHVMMLVEKNGNNFVVYEAVATKSKCSQSTYSRSYLTGQGYKGYTFTGYGD